MRRRSETSPAGSPPADPPPQPAPAGAAVPENPSERPPAVLPALAPGLAAIVTSTFDMPSPDEVYARLLSALDELKPSRADYGTLADALDRAQENARQAMQLLVVSKIAADRYELDAELVLSGMRDQALAMAQAQKDRGERSKAITKEDLAGIMAAKFPDEWHAIETKRAEVRRTKAYLEDLADRMRERARDLRALVSTARG